LKNRWSGTSLPQKCCRKLCSKIKRETTF